MSLKWSRMAHSIPDPTLSSASSCLLFPLLAFPSSLFILFIYSFFLRRPWACLWLPRTLFKLKEKHSEFKKKKSCHNLA